MKKFKNKMIESVSKTTHGIPRVVELSSYAVKNGVINVAEFGSELPFVAKRNYLITAKDASIKGGEHAHKDLDQFFMCVKGSFNIKLSDGQQTFEFELSTISVGLFVPAGWWRTYDLSEDGVVSVLASEVYDEHDYIHDFKELQKFHQKQKEIPFLDLRSVNRQYETDFLDSLSKSIHTSSFVDGVKVERFERDFSEYCGTKYAVSCGNGYDALYLALLALGVGSGDEVIVPSNTFIATAFAVSRTGATPVFVDCTQTDYSLDVTQLNEVFSNKTVGVIPVHLFGIPANMDEINSFAVKKGLFVIEDAAQAHGAKYKSKRVGSLGDVGCFSFYPSKNLGALGDAGCITTNDPSVARKIRLLRNYGSEEKYIHETFGMNSRMDAIQAAFLSTKLKGLNVDNELRLKIASTYTQKLRDIKNMLVVNPRDNVTPSWHLYPIVLKSGNPTSMLDFLAKRGVQAGRHYPVPAHLSPVYNNGNLPSRRSNDLSCSERYSSNCVSLPIDPHLSGSSIDDITDAVADYFN